MRSVRPETPTCLTCCLALEWRGSWATSVFVACRAFAWETVCRMRKLFVVLAASLVFAPRLALLSAENAARQPDLPPHNDFLPIADALPPAHLARTPQPALMLGILAAFAQWRAAFGGTGTLTAGTTPLHHSALATFPRALGVAPHIARVILIGCCGYAAAQPRRRAPPTLHPR